MANARQGGDRINVPGILEVCNFCYHVVPPGGNGGVCICSTVGYCSVECQRLDWRRHHRRTCQLLQAQVQDRVNQNADNEDENGVGNLEQID